jgi:hypothetical protein
MELPIIPLEIEVISLNGLYKFVCDNPDNFQDIDTVILYEYLNNFKNSDFFYLAGHIKITKDEPITQEKLKLAYDKYLIPVTSMDCCNSFEYSSVKLSKIQFEKFMQVISHYYNLQLEAEYALGGPGYERLAGQTMVGKK